MVVRDREIKAVVVMVMVGIPNFSTLDWSTTSHEVQDPQSAWEPITRSAFRPLITLAILCDSWFELLVRMVDLSTS